MQPPTPVRASLARTRFENVTMGGRADFSGQTYIDSNANGNKDVSEVPYPSAQVSRAALPFASVLYKAT